MSVKLGGTRPLATKFCFHEGVEVTIEHRFHVARFVVGAVIFYQLIRRLHVASNLTPPGVVTSLTSD